MVFKANAMPLLFLHDVIALKLFTVKGFGDVCAAGL